ncbi:MAG: hypothetical protein ACI4OG_00515 [Bacilli bacterium]
MSNIDNERNRKEAIKNSVGVNPSKRNKNNSIAVNKVAALVVAVGIFAAGLGIGVKADQRIQEIEQQQLVKEAFEDYYKLFDQCTIRVGDSGQYTSYDMYEIVSSASEMEDFNPDALIAAFYNKIKQIGGDSTLVGGLYREMEIFDLVKERTLEEHYIAQGYKSLSEFVEVQEAIAKAQAESQGKGAK